MNNTVTRLIEAWFACHHNGEFVSRDITSPYTVMGPTTDGSCICFITKQHIALAMISERMASDEFGIIARYGLPSRTDLRWIKKLIGPGGVLFLGDMDPVDLMVFAWLRARLHPRTVVHIGINDALLAATRISSTKSLSMPCGPSELESLVLLKSVLPDLEKTVGSKCALMLEKGRKIELDGIGRDRKRRRAIAQFINETCAK